MNFHTETETTDQDGLSFSNNNANEHQGPRVIEFFDGEDHWTDIQKFGIGLAQLADSHGITRDVQREIFKYINRNLIQKIDPVTIESKCQKVYVISHRHTNTYKIPIGLGGMVPSIERIQRLINKSARQIVKQVHVCSAGCYLYNQDDAYPIQCPNPECKKYRYKDENRINEVVQANTNLNNINVKLEPVQTMSIVSIAASLAELLLDDNTRQEFNYRSNFNSIPGERDEDEAVVYEDVFSGSIYKNMYLNGNLVNNDDILLTIYVDGYPNKSKPKSTQTLINCIIMNIDPSQR
jgi:hypothetical protein